MGGCAKCREDSSGDLIVSDNQIMFGIRVKWACICGPGSYNGRYRYDV